MTTTQKIGWIGLGKLGLPMAGRLVATGHAVTGFDQNAARMTLARERGIALAATHDEALEGASLVFTSLPDDRVLDAAIVRSGLLERLAPGAILIETSTVSPGASAAVAEAAAKTGVAYLRLPISGSAPLAETGQVSCFASGPRAAFDQAKPVLEGFTKAQTWLGEGEQARYAKLAINLMIGVSAGMMAEALALARKGGIDWNTFLGVMGESAVASPFVKYKAGPLAARDFSPMFTARQFIKDLDLIVDAAGSVLVPVPLAAMLRQSYSAILAEGEGDEDFITVVRHIERLSGLGEPE